MSDTSFLIPKSKVVNFLQREINRKGGIPSVGAYDVGAALDKISKGRKSYR